MPTSIVGLSLLSGFIELVGADGAARESRGQTRGGVRA